LLVIDSNRLRQEIAQLPTSHNVWPQSFEAEGPEYMELTTDVSGTVFALPQDLKEAQNRLLALRQRLISEGNKPVSGDDLDQIIAESRGRS